MKYLASILALWLMTLSGTTWAQREVTAPGMTPPEFKRTAAQFAHQRARALEAVDKALGNKGQNGTSSIGRLVSGVSALSDQIDRNVNDLQRALPDHDGEVKAAMLELIEIYRENQARVGDAAQSASQMLNIHQQLFGVIAVIELEKDNSIVRRRKCEVYAAEIAEAVDRAVEARVPETIGGGTFQQAMTVFNGMIKGMNGTAVIAETLDHSVESEKADLKEFLSEYDPKTQIDAINDADRAALGRASKAWATYHSRWHNSLKSHISEIQSAYRDFERTVDKPWTELYRTYTRAKVQSVKEATQHLLGVRAQLEDKMEKEEREAAQRQQELQEQFEDTEEELEDAEDQRDNLERQVEIKEEQVKDADDAEEKDDLEEALEDLERQLEEMDEKTETLRETLDQIEEFLKKS